MLKFKWSPGRGASVAALFVLLAGCAKSSESELDAAHLAHVSPPSTLHHLGAGAGLTLIGTPLADNPNVALGWPKTTPGADVAISRSEYVVAWSEGTRDLRWAAWRVRSSDLSGVARQNVFAPDPDLEAFLATTTAKRAVDPRDYDGSCFDRGHQVPSADRTATVDDNAKTFYMSNMIPQTAFLNRGMWAHLEEHTRSLVAGTNDVLYVFAGPIYGGKARGIGPQHDILVPTKDFKIVVRPPQKAGGKPEIVAAVMMPNVTSKGTDPLVDHEQACIDQGHQNHASSASLVSEQATSIDTLGASDWEQYETTLPQIERESGLDFSFLGAGAP